MEEGIAQMLAASRLNVPGCVGCGSLLGMKIALAAMESRKPVFVVSESVYETPVPFHVSHDPAAAASAIACAMPENIVIAYANDTITSASLASLNIAMRKNAGFIYICCNESVSYGRVADALGGASYLATASVAFPEDFIAKLGKAANVNGFRFIELHSPCPEKWAFDTSNTIEVARLAFETGFWQIFEIENRRLLLTKRPMRLEPVARYLESFKSEPADGLDEKIQQDWKMLNQGRLL